jgi:NAD(P)-dependent dehydrogenase (short-subunit alcohol dehydrogenase family)
MISTFGETSTTEDVLAGVDLVGKRVLVTGVSSGLGVETARTLVAHGADVVGAARDVGKAEAVTREVRAVAGREGAFELVELDLASLASVRVCADRLVERGGAFDLVIANAGVMATPYGRTIDGFETQFGTNHLGHFVFVNRIAPLMRPGARFVSLSSSGHKGSDVDIDDPNFERTDYNPWLGYGRSKTANILFAVEFDRRHCERGVRACAVHPGRILTNLGRHLGDGGMKVMLENADKLLRERGELPAVTKSVEQGAATSVWAGIVAPGELIGGRLCEDCGVAEINDDRERLTSRGGVRSYAVDPTRAQALWVSSEEMVGESFPAGE